MTILAPYLVYRGQREPLTSAQWLRVFDRLARAVDTAASPKISSLRIDLSDVTWIGHLPLLALCLLVEKTAALHAEDASVSMPNSETVRAFLDRWRFYDFLRSRKFKASGDATLVYKESSLRSCVLPIRTFHSEEDVDRLAAEMQDTGERIYNLLRTDAFLDDERIHGLADLIVKELCMNAVEHSSAGNAFIFGRVSRPDDKVRRVYEENAARWETKFFNAIHGEGMTELVFGDGGLGIVQTLAAEAQRYGKTTPGDILTWAFEPFSTSKGERGDHTRGLWVVKNHVRELRGVLYVRTWDNDSGGVSASWDFFNEPGRDEPFIETDRVPFPGTQFQILLPHLNVQRPYTFISSDRAATAAANVEIRPIGYQIPPVPPADGEKQPLLDAIRALEPHDVLFIDMSRMDHAAWTRSQIDTIGKHISAGLATKFGRIWLLNPKEMLTLLASSSWVTDLWRRHGILQPVVSREDDSLPPKVSFVVSNSADASGKDGDTPAARRELYRLISTAFGPDPVNRSSMSPLTPAEHSWVTVHLAMNSPSVELRSDGTIAPAFDVETLADATVQALLPDSLREQIAAAFAKQAEMPDRLLYQLPSEKYCKNYIDPRILADLDAGNRTAMEKWIEERVAASGAGYAISYTNFASMLLTRASRGNPGIRCLPPLKHYLPGEYDEMQQRIPMNANVVVLVAISGSATTIEKILQRLQARKATATVICLINTTAARQRTNMPLLAAVEANRRFQSLLTQPIEVYDEIPAGYDKRYIAPIDPETLVPLPPPNSMRPELTDGEFWSITGEARALSVDPITYKGRDYTTPFSMRNLFKSTEAGNSRALEAVLQHVEKLFGGRGPDIICANHETDQALKGTHAKQRTQAYFPNAKVTSERDADFEKVTSKLENKNVVIFAAAAYSGSAITRLLKSFATARQIHVCVFLTRISEPMIASFTRLSKVKFSAFCQLHSGSSESSTGSSRTIRLQNLRDYRPSCVSHRLLLFVEELQEDVAPEIGAPDPDSLELVTSPLRKPAPGLFQKGRSFKFTSAKGMEDLADLVRRCEDADNQWVYAVLEEAASHFEIARRGLSAEKRAAQNSYVGNVSTLWQAAQTPALKLTVLRALILDRWHGRKEIRGYDVAGFGHALLSELIRRDSPTDLRAACIRALSKVDRGRLITELEPIINVAREERDTELTLALELTKILDDESAFEQLRSELETLIQRQAHLPESASSVALQCLLKDAGLQYENRQVTFLPWPRMVEILLSEPPDPARTIRSLIRSIRGDLGSRARILYYWRDESSPSRFMYLDAWPREEASLPRPVPVRNIAAAELLDGQNDFYSPNVSDPAGPDKAYERYFTKLGEQDQEELRNDAMFLHRIGKGGILRVFYEPAEGSGMPDGAVRRLQDAVGDVNTLLMRTDSPLTHIGTYQYRQTVEKFQTHSQDRVNPLHEFVKHVHSLLGADVGSLVVLEESGIQWRRDYVLPPAEFEPRTFPADDRKRVTSDVASSRRFRRFRDHAERLAAGFQYDGLVNWAPAWLAMPMTQHDGCRVVLHLWHHIPGWFDQHPKDLIDSLSSLGGGIAQIKADYEKAREVQLRSFDRIEIDSVAAELRNQTLIAEGLALDARDDGSIYKLSDLYDCVVDIHRNVESLLTIVQEKDSLPASSDLSDLVTMAVTNVRGENANDRFELPLLTGSRVDVPVADPRMFLRAMVELLKSAGTHLQGSGKIRVGLDYVPTGAVISIEIINPDPGITDEQRLKIFDPTEVALKMARITIRRHGGRIEEVGGAGENAAFRITVPTKRGGERQ